MKLAFLILCHTLPDQLNKLLTVLDHPDCTCFVHVDRKSQISSQIIKRDNIIILPDEFRVDVGWGTFSQVEASYDLLHYARKHADFDYYWLISGQCFPIKPIEEILLHLGSNTGANYINLFPSKNSGLGYANNYDKRNEILFPKFLFGRKIVHRIMRRLWVETTGGYNRTFRIFKRKSLGSTKFYFGSSWWCVTGSFADWVIEYLEKNPDYYHFFGKSSCPDECFYQTLLMNSPFASTRMEYLHYIDWPEHSNSPKDLTLDDFDKIVSSGKYMARKINGDHALIDRLSNQ